MVEADGVPAYTVHITVRPKAGKWPEVNQLLPVVFDRSDPTRVEIVWDQVPSLQDRVQLRKAARLEAAQRATTSGSGSVAPTGDSSPQDMMRQALANPAAFAETMRPRHGVSPSALGQSRGGRTSRFDPRGPSGPDRQNRRPPRPRGLDRERVPGPEGAHPRRMNRRRRLSYAHLGVLQLPEESAAGRSRRPLGRDPDFGPSCG